MKRRIKGSKAQLAAQKPPTAVMERPILLRLLIDSHTRATRFRAIKLPVSQELYLTCPSPSIPYSRDIDGGICDPAFHGAARSYSFVAEERPGDTLSQALPR